MHLTSLEVENYRSFAGPQRISFGRMNVLIGPNNAGKSSLLRAISTMQGGAVGDLHADVRLGAREAVIKIGLKNFGAVYPAAAGPNVPAEVMLYTTISKSKVRRSINWEGPNISVEPILNKEPHHFIVPYLSNRKTGSYNEDVREAYALKVESQFTNLSAKLSRLSNRYFPGHDRYVKTCEAILGFVVTAVPSENGQRPGVYLPDRSVLFINQMGEGVPNIVGLLADLSLAEEKLFLVEEPENDLHPSALKALLELMAESSKNQFIVSTHSNIVARYLCAVPDSRLYYIESKHREMPPQANVRAVEPTPQARLAVLRELGYSLSDFDLWDGWLILEESSAERIIRDYLIPWFAPKLTRVRTLAAGGNSQVEPTFDDFFRLVRFTHLEDVYRSRTWVLIDGDENGKAIVERLRDRYPTWNSDRFDSFDQVEFESYYPQEFSQEVKDIRDESDKVRRRHLKQELIARIRPWLDENELRGRAALAKSAKEIIKRLQHIEAELISCKMAGD
jgi:hypothetical protein